VRLLNHKHPQLNLTEADANLIKEHTGTHTHTPTTHTHTQHTHTRAVWCVMCGV
jgi:hypothetical protein